MEINYYSIVGAAVLAVVGLHYLVHRGLAPARIFEIQTPGDLGIPYSEVSIPTANNKRLYGWFVQGPDSTASPAVVLMHGWGGNAETLLPLVRPLRQAGFALLLFDARCHGRSDEDSYASLPRFAEDLENSIDWLAKHDSIDGRRIAVVGHSVGAAAALLVASRRVDIAAVVSIATFAHPQTMMRRLLASYHIPYWPIGWYILRYVQYVIGHRFEEIAPLTTISQVRCPTLLVHGAEDTTVPVAEAYAIFAARGNAPVQMKIISGSHDDYDDTEQEAAYLARFIDKTVLTLDSSEQGG